MEQNEKREIKSAAEIGALAKQLNPANQIWVLNTINTLLYSQQIQHEKVVKK